MSQIMPLMPVGSSPGAMQVEAAVSQQPPPPQVSPGQHGVPGKPQTSQLPAEHVPSPQSPPSETQTSLVGSQQPLPSQESPGQQG
jgi:hypothetical protein